MRAAFPALMVAVAMVAASPVFAQLASRPARGSPAIMLAPIEVSSFATYRDFYAHIAKKRGLAEPEGDLAIGQIESRASIEHLHDYSGDPIVVVKLDAPRAGDNSSFFVLREKSDHLCLLGEMKARSYESTTASGHLEFVLDVGRRVAPAPRYQVDGDFLVDLADLASLDRDDPLELDVKHAF